MNKNFHILGFYISKGDECVFFEEVQGNTVAEVAKAFKKKRGRTFLGRWRFEVSEKKELTSTSKIPLRVAELIFFCASGDFMNSNPNLRYQK